jgi:hypothetical protein
MTSAQLAAGHAAPAAGLLIFFLGHLPEFVHSKANMVCGRSKRPAAREAATERKCVPPAISAPWKIQERYRRPSSLS